MGALPSALIQPPRTRRQGKRLHERRLHQQARFLNRNQTARLKLHATWVGLHRCPLQRVTLDVPKWDGRITATFRRN
jgi:hypothetical protein